MCYSAQLRAKWSTYQRQGGKLGLTEFAKLYGLRLEANIKIPKAIDAWFDDVDDPACAEIRALIARYNKASAEKWEQELFKQRKRLADAERALQSKTTKKAQEDVRIAGSKVEQLKGWLDDLKRTEPQSRDARIYPNYYAPVIVQRDGERVIVPMRYNLRPHGKPPSIDRLGTLYNARRDNLEKFWKDHWGHYHGLIIASAFFEHVERDGEDVVLKFEPRTGQDMLVACLWSQWVDRDGSVLHSFAAVTDEPPEEVRAAGHDRCIIPIKAEHVDAWLTPEGRSSADLYRILDDRERPYYEHRIAA